MGTRRVRRADGMDDRKMMFVVKRFQSCKRGMQSEKTVEIDRSAVRASQRLRDGNLRPHRCVVPVSERHNHRNAVGCTALKDRDDDGMIFALGGVVLSERCAYKK